MRNIHSKWCGKVHRFMFLVLLPTLVISFLSPILVCLWCYDLFAGVLNATVTTVVPWGRSFISASGYLLWRIEGRGTFAQNRTGDVLRFFLLFPLSSTDHRQYWSWKGHGNICAVCSTQSQMSWPHRTFALSLPSPDNWSHGWGHPCYL